MTLSRRFEDALGYATIVHAGQVRKGTCIPYISHLLLVAGIALEHGAGEDEAIAALLHDAVEDAGGKARLDDIRARFGARVAAIVLGCTDTDVTPKPPWRPRKEAYVGHVAAESDASILLVSAADKLANCRSIVRDYRECGEEVWARFHAGRDDVLWYYRSLADSFLAKTPTPLARELDRAVAELEAICPRGTP